MFAWNFYFDAWNYNYEERIVNPDAKETSDDPHEVEDAVIKQFKERGTFVIPVTIWRNFGQAWAGHQKTY